MDINNKRPQIGKACLELYMRDYLRYSQPGDFIPQVSPDINQENIQDLISDLYHLASQLGISEDKIEAMKDMGYTNYLSEAI